jgi:hypothetical protein
MRVALLASTFALVAGSPAFAQCIYVACNGGNQALTPAPISAPSYEEGYAAGLAARSETHTISYREVVRTTRSRASNNASVKRTKASTGHRAASASSTRRHPAPSARRHAPVRTAHTHRTTNTRLGVHHRTYTSSHAGTYQDPIKDRAATYRSAAYGQSTSMSSVMSSSSSYSSYATTTWSGPASVVNQGGQICGWGARIVTNPHGQTQRQAMWVCQCPQGWRPPGY